MSELYLVARPVSYLALYLKHTEKVLNKYLLKKCIVSEVLLNSSSIFSFAHCIGPDPKTTYPSADFTMSIISFSLICLEFCPEPLIGLTVCTLRRSQFQSAPNQADPCSCRFFTLLSTMSNIAMSKRSSLTLGAMHNPMEK